MFLIKCWRTSYNREKRNFNNIHSDIETVAKVKKYILVNKKPFSSSFLRGTYQDSQGLFIQDLGNTHRLLFNKFNIYKKHLLVTTRDFEEQSVPLTKEDFRQTVFAFKANRGLYFFNSGPEAGASQKHKHIQIFPEEARNLPIFKSILEFVRERKNNIEECSIIEYPPFNFQHGLIVIGAVKMYSES